jgi:hypothetical protein
LSFLCDFLGYYLCHFLGALYIFLGQASRHSGSENSITAERSGATAGTGCSPSSRCSLCADGNHTSQHQCRIAECGKTGTCGHRARDARAARATTRTNSSAGSIRAAAVCEARERGAGRREGDWQVDRSPGTAAGDYCPSPKRAPLMTLCFLLRQNCAVAGQVTVAVMRSRVRMKADPILAASASRRYTVYCGLVR